MEELSENNIINSILSEDKDVIVTPDWVITVVEPISSLKQMFEEKVNGKECEVSLVES